MRKWGKEGQAFFLGHFAWWLGRARQRLIGGGGSGRNRSYRVKQLVGRLYWVK